jgi:hypothetical protein
VHVLAVRDRDSLCRCVLYCSTGVVRSTFTKLQTTHCWQSCCVDNAVIIAVAAEMNKLEALQELLRRGVDIHRQVGEGGSALMRAGMYMLLQQYTLLQFNIVFVSSSPFMVSEPPVVRYVVQYAASTHGVCVQLPAAHCSY